MVKPFKVVGICGSCNAQPVPLLICGCRGQPVPIFFCYRCYEYIHSLKMNVNYTGKPKDLKDYEKTIWEVPRDKLVKVVKGK